ncbi:hypothetical protein C8Q75DRAFT_769585 [Abortiporus biennis]|nr:hypothetical protein C8Q75DRAFT_769585 [Abortiporus biennis]
MGPCMQRAPLCSADLGVSRSPPMNSYLQILLAPLPFAMLSNDVCKLTTTFSSVTDPFAAYSSQPTPFVSYDQMSHIRPTISTQPVPGPSTLTASSSSPTSKRRGSILVAASDAINNFTHFGRRKRIPLRPSTAVTPTPIILSEVIEISASRRQDAEDEERERLRDVAAQSLGLGPVLLEDALSRLDTSGEAAMNRDDSEHETDDRDRPPESDITGFSSVSVSVSVPPPPIGSSSSTSAAVIPFTSRTRSGSIARSLHSHSNSYSRANSTTPLPAIPAFPTTHALIKPFIQCSSTFPKHYPPPSLLMFALSKQWKTRFIVLTTPSPPRPIGSATSSFRASTGPAVSYLHLFKGSGADERELERLEINEDSVVFLSDEEVGGRRNVVKVGGIDVGVMRRELNTEEDGRTMWLLQISDSTESQNWIAAIKSALLSQRSFRAGLGNVGQNVGAVEPRGDLDVMLSMRAQGLFPQAPLETTSPSATPRVQSPRLGGSSNGQAQFVDHNLTPPASLSRSHSRQNTQVSGFTNGTSSPTPSSRNAVTALKGLFTTRPRSPSAASVSSDLETPDDSFGSAGTNLLMLRSNSFSSERQFSPTSSVFSPVSSSSSATPRMTITEAHMLDRKIIPDSNRQMEWSPITHNGRLSSMSREADRKSSMENYSPSLQPPPRRRAWTSSGPASSTNKNMIIGSGYTYTHANGSTAESLGVKQHTNGQYTLGPAFTPEDAPRQSREGRPRTSWSSMTSSNGDYSPPADTNGKRWSRYGTFAQHRLTPPNGSPPEPSSPPHSPLAHNSHQRLPNTRHPYAFEGTPSRSSSIHSTSPQNLVLDLRPLSPKRASGSSVHSFSTVSTSHSRSTGLFTHRPLSSHRVSMPPPQRPAPNSALPPTPNEESFPNSPRSAQSSSPPTKSSFRDALSLRGHRLSLSPPSLPPTSTLPPRPDEPTYRSHRKSSSIGSVHSFSPLYPIPASPTPLESPYPPPVGPLPPTPSGSSVPPTPTTPSLTTPTRASISFKQRLRILSAPTPSPPPSTPDLSLSQEEASSINHPPLQIFTDTSIPSTPIGEPITTLQNDPNFLSFAPPTPPSRVLPSIFPDMVLPEPEKENAGITSLSPPPRRGSRRISTPDKEKLLSREGASSLPSMTAEADEERKGSNEDRDQVGSTSNAHEDNDEDPRVPDIQVHELSELPLLVDDIVASDVASAMASYDLSPKPRPLDHCAVSLVDVSI